MSRTIALAAALALQAGTAQAADPPGASVIRLVLEDHRFIPSQVTAPPGVKVTIEVVNEDASTDEFDSSDLLVEEDITPHGRVRFTVGPLKPGTYAFEGELHPKTAQGVLTVPAAP